MAAIGLAATLAMGANSPPTPTRSTLDDDAVVAAIDARIRDGWKRAGYVASAAAPDGAWARRVTLDLVGRVPTVGELARFLGDPPRQRRALLVERLLGDEHRAERSRWFALRWANTLVGRTGGRTGGSRVHRPGLVAYLEKSAAERRSFDRLVTELLTATGSVRPEDEDFQGAANFLVDKLGDNGVQATAQTARLFLGTAVQCTQCHDHPFNEEKQSQFWELNAFFRQVHAEPIRDENGNGRYARLEDRDFAGEGPRRTPAPGVADRAEIYYELRNGRLQVAYPVFPGGESLDEVFADRGEGFGDTGRVADVNRRKELAKLLVAAPDFARAAVNREWQRLLGYGLTRPADDMGPHNPPSHPELLDELAEAFRASGHDLDRLDSWIVRSEAYGLDSRAGRTNEKDDPALGEPPAFSRFYLRQLDPEQVFDSLMTATKADAGLSAEQRDTLADRWLRQFASSLENDEAGEATTFNGSIPQVLALMNGELTRRATELSGGPGWRRGALGRGQRLAGQPGGAAGSMAQAPSRIGFLAETAVEPSLDDRQRVERLYLAALARRPDRAELRLCDELLAARKGNVAEALRDVWWALLNSNEFVLQH